MKTELLFAAASLMLIGAMVVFALTSAVQADKATGWCYSDATKTYCGDTNKICKDQPTHLKGEKCEKVTPP